MRARQGAAPRERERADEPDTGCLGRVSDAQTGDPGHNLPRFTA